MEDESRISWSDVFKRSSLSPVLFNVHKEFRENVIKALEDSGLRRLKRQTILGGPSSSGFEAYAATAVLDGYVIELIERWGFPAGDALPSGMRIVGTRPMRLLCLLLNLQPPARRLRAELFAPTEEVLFDQLADQRRQTPSDLDSLAERAIGIRDTSELLALVIDLFGEEVVPNPSNAVLGLLPGEGQWGEAGLNRFVQTRLEREGVDAFDATEWMEMGFDLSEITALKEFVPQAGREFHALGYRPYLIAQMLQKGIAVETPEAHVAAGLDDRNLAAEAAIGGYTVEEVEAFVSTGMAQLRGFRDILRSGLSMQSATDWLVLGFEPQVIERLTGWGWSLGAATEALDGIPKEQWNQASRGMRKPSG